ncbi:MAG: hypothetical protein HYZ47_03630 [Simkania negevensis]|nr:hypothetical protein [Simkania negevensis]
MSVPSVKQFGLDTAWSLKTFFNQSGTSLSASSRIAPLSLPLFGVPAKVPEVEKEIGNTLSLVYCSQNLSNLFRKTSFSPSMDWLWNNGIEFFSNAAPMLTALHVLGVLTLPKKTVAILDVTSGLVIMRDLWAALSKKLNNSWNNPNKYIEYIPILMQASMLFIVTSGTVHEACDFIASPPQFLNTLRSFFTSEKSVFMSRMFITLSIVNHFARGYVAAANVKKERVQGPKKPEREVLSLPFSFYYIDQLKPKGVVATILVGLELFGRKKLAIDGLSVDTGKAFDYLDNLRRQFSLSDLGAACGTLLEKVCYFDEYREKGYSTLTIEMLGAVFNVLKDFGSAMKWLAAGPIPALQGRKHFFCDMKNTFSIGNAAIQLLPLLGVIDLFDQKDKREIKRVSKPWTDGTITILREKEKESLTMTAKVSIACLLLFQGTVIAYNLMDLSKRRQWYLFTEGAFQWARRAMACTFFVSLYTKYQVKKASNLEAQEWLFATAEE